MNKLDKKLDRIIYLIDKLPDKEVVNIQEWQKAQIKATILQEIKKDMPKPRGVKTKSMLFVDTFQESYNRALEDCLAAIKHLLG